VLFQTHAPGAALSDFIENFWLYDGYSCPHKHARILPVGTFELVFNLRNDELQIQGGNESRLRSRYSGAVVSGPYNGFFTVEETSLMGVHFRPGGALPFLGLSAYELANTHIDLATIWGRRGQEIRERLAVAPSSGHRFRLLENALLSRLHRPLEHHPAVSLADYLRWLKELRQKGLHVKFNHLPVSK
jgi:hypothetical protein